MWANFRFFAVLGVMPFLPELHKHLHLKYKFTRVRANVGQAGY